MSVCCYSCHTLPCHISCKGRVDMKPGGLVRNILMHTIHQGAIKGLPVFPLLYQTIVANESSICVQRLDNEGSRSHRTCIHKKLAPKSAESHALITCHHITTSCTTQHYCSLILPGVGRRKVPFRSQVIANTNKQYHQPAVVLTETNLLLVHHCLNVPEKWSLTVLACVRL